MRKHQKQPFRGILTTHLFRKFLRLSEKCYWWSSRRKKFKAKFFPKFFEEEPLAKPGFNQLEGCQAITLQYTDLTSF